MLSVWLCVLHAGRRALDGDFRACRRGCRNRHRNAVWSGRYGSRSDDVACTHAVAWKGFFATSGEDQKLFFQTKNSGMDITATAGNLLVQSNDDIRVDGQTFNYVVAGEDAQNRAVWVTTDAQDAGISWGSHGQLLLNIGKDMVCSAALPCITCRVAADSGALQLFEVTDPTNNGHNIKGSFQSDMLVTSTGTANDDGITMTSAGSDYDGILGEYVGVLVRWVGVATAVASVDMIRHTHVRIRWTSLS